MILKRMFRGITYILLLAISINLYGTHGATGAIGDILDLKDYEFLYDQLSPVTPGQAEMYKEVYSSKQTGEKWLVSKAFNASSYRYYVGGGVYSLLLAHKGVPEVRLMRDEKNQLRIGSKIIPKFSNLQTFFHMDVDLLMQCFPTGCLMDKHLLDPFIPGGQIQQRITIEGAEDILAAMLFLADIDGNHANLGLIEEGELGMYRVGKVDHEEIFACASMEVPLRSLAKIVFGERHQYTASLNYTRFDLNKIADAFDRFAKIDPKDLSRLFVDCLAALYDATIDQSNWSPDLQALDIPQVAQMQHNIFKERLELCVSWAQSLRLEAAIQSNDKKKVEALCKNSLDPNGRYEYLFLDAANFVPPDTLTEMCSMFSHGDTRLLYSVFMPYLYAEEPISPLEMAIRYDKPTIVNYLCTVSNTATLREALNNVPDMQRKYNIRIQKLLKK